jgi:hypothetical protein
MRLLVPLCTTVLPIVSSAVGTLGVAHVPSPRQNVVADADVPPLRLVTGRFPVTPVDRGKPVQLVNVPADGVPMFGVTKVGLVAKTREPVPVSSVIAAARLALDGVAKNVATFAPSPLTPVATGNPVQLVSVPDAGVPSAGVTSVGDVASTTLPLPVVPLLRFDAASCPTVMAAPAAVC